MSKEPVSSVVVLIHGRNGRGARWPLVERVAAERLLETVHVKYFEWTGKADVRHQAETVANLRAQFREWYLQFPTATFYVVGHGDGGNVALHALAHDLDLRRIAALICLSTAFVDAQPRPDSAHADVLLALSAVAWAAGAIALGHLLGLGFLSAVLVLAVTAALVFWRTRGADGRISPLLADMAMPDPVFPHLFVLRSPRDHAARWVTVTPLVHVLLSGWRQFLALFGLGSEPSVLPRRVTPVMLTTALLASAAWAALTWTYWSLVPSQWVEGPLGLFLLFYACMSVGVVLLLAALIALAFFALVALPLLGASAWLVTRRVSLRDLFAAMLYLDLTVEPQPPGSFESCQLSWRHDTDEGGTLTNTATFEDADAIERTGRWLREAQDARMFAATQTVAQR